MSNRLLRMLRSTIQGNDAFTTLLVHADGADGATSFNDYSSFQRALTCSGNAQLDTAQFKFGRSSLLFDGNDDFVTFVNDAGMELAAGDFTLEAWVRFNALPGSGTFATFISKSWVSPTYSYFFGLQNTAGVYTIEFFTSSNGTGLTVQTQRTITPSTGVWYHFAVSRQGTSLRIFLNGVQQGATATDGTNMFAGGGNLHLGISAGATNDLNGWMDEIRISKGIARWTATFNPPGQPYG